jgi:membrane associated rhomboid family serine protease
MPRTSNFQFGFPRFTGSLRTLVILSTAIYITLVLLWRFADPVAEQVVNLAALRPVKVQQGWVWQLLTYGFLDGDPLHFLMTMLAVYFLGSAVQDRIGSRPFLELYLSSLIGAGTLATLLAWAGLGSGAALGAGAAANGILMVFYLLFREAPIMLFPLPIPIPVKYIVIFTAAVEGVYFLLSHEALYFMVLLLGLAMGYLWYRYLWRRASLFAAVEGQIYRLRNSYHRWKRRRAGRKFQVYMRKHQHDPKQYFDEYGNFKPPDDGEKKNGGKGGWVN